MVLRPTLPCTASPNGHSQERLEGASGRERGPHLSTLSPRDRAARLRDTPPCRASGKGSERVADGEQEARANAALCHQNARQVQIVGVDQFVAGLGVLHTKTTADDEARADHRLATDVDRTAKAGKRVVRVPSLGGLVGTKEE